MQNCKIACFKRWAMVLLVFFFFLGGGEGERVRKGPRTQIAGFRFRPKP